MSAKNLRIFVLAAVITLAQNVLAQEVEQPFAGRQYHTDATAYRAVASGRSSNLNTAKSKAILAARKLLAGEVEFTIKGVTSQITTEQDLNGDLNFESSFEECTREVVSQKLQGVSVSNEKALQKGSVYTYWVVVEMPKADIVDGVFEAINKDEKLKLDYDKQRFEEIFNEEMRKLEEEQQ